MSRIIKVRTSNIINKKFTVYINLSLDSSVSLFSTARLYNSAIIFHQETLYVNKKGSEKHNLKIDIKIPEWSIADIILELDLFKENIHLHNFIAIIQWPHIH